MKIVVIGLRGFPNIQGGIETHCQHLYPRLVEKGNDVFVLARSPYVGRKKYAYRGVNIVPLFSPKHRALEAIVHTFISTLYLIILRPQIVHYHAIGPSIFVPLAKILGFKVVVTHHGFDYDRKKWGNFAKLLIKTGEKQLKRANAVISISEHISNFLKKQNICTPYLIPNGVDLPSIAPQGDYCHELGIKKNQFIFFAGRFVPEKNIDDLINAFLKIKTNWKLVIAGDADHEDAYSLGIKKIAAENENVILTGFISGEKLKEVFSNAGCFVLPSSHEGLPIALLEALSYGLPCVASNIPANKSIGHHSIKYFKLHDIDALSKELYVEIHDAKKMDHDQIREFIRENYNWDDIADRTLEIYDNVIKCNYYKNYQRKV